MKNIKNIITYLAIFIFGMPWMPFILILCLGIAGVPLNYWTALILWAVLLWVGMLGFKGEGERKRNVRKN